MFCQNCGRELEEGSIFCSNCGAPVEAGKRNPNMGNAGLSLPEKEQIADRGEKQAVHKKGKGSVIAIVSAAIVLVAAGVTGGVLYFTSDGYISRKNMKLAEECFDEKEYEEALAYYTEALERDPGLQSIPVWRERGAAIRRNFV